MLDVGDRVIDLVPVSLKNLAISLFGTNDKLALLIGIAALTTILAALVGVVTFRGHAALGVAGITLFALVGTVSVLTARADRELISLLPSLLGGAAGVGALLWQYRVARAEQGSPDLSVPEPGASPLHSRRRALTLGAGLTGLGVATLAFGRILSERFSAAASRAAVILPKVRSPLPDPGESVRVDVPGVSEFFTPNASFYRIDTALSVPQINLETWRMKVTGEVDKDLEFSYEDLLAESQVEADITLTCVSNEVGGDLLGNARWQGLRLDDLLERAGVSDGADQIVGRSVDGYTCGFPTAALDGRDALVAIAMNGEPLPLAHGFPARLIVPGLYGYVSATKWLSEIELTRFDRFDQYWVPRGYAVQAPIKTSSRIDTPKGLSKVDPGPVMVGGVAWAQTRGIESVQIRLDGGPWQETELAEGLNKNTWRQWKWRWNATPGRHSLAIRAIDGSGAIQTAERSEPLPDGSTGLHQIVVLVND